MRQRILIFLAALASVVPSMLLAQQPAAPRLRVLTYNIHHGIDYVLVRRHDPWQVQEVTIVPDDVTSDHRPVLVVLQWGSD